MKNIQRSLRALALLTLLVLAFTISAQESTEEAETPVEITAEATAPAEVTEQATPAPEMTEEATPAPEMTAEATSLAEMTEEAVVTISEPEGVSINITGSGIVNPALEAIVTASGSTLTYTFNTTGTNAGFETFCANTADITTAIRPISVEEDTACRDAGVEFIELLIGYDVLAVVGNPEDDFLTCLTADNLNVLLSPSATVTNWDELGFGATASPAEGEAESTEEPTMLPDVTVLLPEDTTLAFENLNELVTGFGFRADASSANVATILDTVSATSGAIGFVPLADALNAGEAVSIVDLNLVGSCINPSVETVENESYPAGTAFYLYVATSAQENLAFLLDYLTQAAYTTALNEAGYTGISEDALSLNTAIITGDVSARAATAEEVTFIIPQGLAGNVNVAGALSGFTIGDGVANRLTSNQQSLVVNTNFAGEAAGIEAFCNGDVDIVFVEGTGDLCDGAVETVSYDFGTQAVVLVANTADSFANCLTLEQINTIWATSTDPITSWSGIGEGFPEQDIVLVGVNSGNLLTGILMNSVSEGIALPVRVDVAETNASSSYRASAVGNVSGGLSYMSWIDYQSVVEAGESNVQLVAVNSGNGCVVPSEASIIDGSYTISRSLQMVVKQSSLARIEVQSFVWSVFDDTNANVIAASDFVGGFQSQQIISFRSDLLAQFETAEQAALEASAEVTPEVTPEMTEEASDE